MCIRYRERREERGEERGERREKREDRREKREERRVATLKVHVDQQVLLQEEQSPSYTCASIDSRTILTSLLARSLERTTRADMEAISLRT